MNTRIWNHLIGGKSIWATKVKDFGDPGNLIDRETDAFLRLDSKSI